MYKKKEYDLIGLEGFSDNLLNNHFKLYAGYVTNTNKSIELLGTLDKSSPEYAELKRRFGWEFNGMRLHELYFGNLTKETKDIGEFSKILAEEFGSYEEWEKDFKSTASMRGIGWVILAYDKEGKMFNVWINEHDMGHLAGAVPLLVIDVFEHAFMIDYGLNKADYISAFFKAIDWAVVAQRLESSK